MRRPASSASSADTVGGYSFFSTIFKDFEKKGGGEKCKRKISGEKT